MNSKLLDYKFKVTGIVMLLAATALTIFYFTMNFRFSIPVFAVFSSFLETKFFTVFTTNFADELILLLFLFGFYLVAFSKEKNEKEFYQQLRVDAFIQAVKYSAAFLLFSILFIYGNGFITMLVINMYAIFVFYLVIFYRLRHKPK
jgi:hypothetical protein